MYQVRFNNDIIYDPRGANETDKLIIRDPQVHLAVNSAGSMSFVIDSDHPYISKLKRMTGRIELLEDGAPVFRGRIVRDTKDFYGTREIEVEGQLACLNDSLIKPHDFPGDFEKDADYQAAAASGNVVEFYLGWLLDQHNAQVGEEQKIKLGTVTVKGPDNYISRTSEGYTNTWKTVTDKLSDSELGGYLLVRYEGKDTYLDYYADLPTPISDVQTVEFAQNLLDLEDEVYSGDIYTAILPVGADGLTIQGLSDGKLSNGFEKFDSIIYDPKAVETYGMIIHSQTWNEVTAAADLQNKASAMLKGSGLAMPDTITCKAVDMHCVDGEVSSFRVGRYIQVTSQPHKISQLYPFMELDIDILDPGSTIVTLGQTTNTLTAAIQSRQARDGKDGKDGAAGADGTNGRGIDTVEVQYCLSASEPSVTDEGWSSTIPTITDDNHLWSRDKVTYTDGSVEYTTACDLSKATEELAQATEEKVTEIVANSEGIVFETLKRYVQENYVGADVYSTNIASLDSRLNITQDNVSTLVSKVVKNESNLSEWKTGVEQNAKNVEIRLQEITNDGVSRVTTETGYTFDKDGLCISKSGSEMENLLDNTGMYVKRDDEVMLQANNNGVMATDVTVRNYLIIGNYSRFEDYTDGVDSKRTACFHLG